MKWILIVLFQAAGNYTSVLMQEFDSNRACVDASKAIIEAKAAMDALPRSLMAYRCVPKG